MKAFKQLAVALGLFLGSIGIVYGAVTILPVLQGGTGWAAIQSGYVTIGNGTAALSTSTAAYVDTTNNRFGVGTSTPASLFSINPNGISTFAFAIGSSTANYFSINPSGGIVLQENKPATTTAIKLNWASTGPSVLYQIGNAGVTISVINATTSLYAGSRKLVTVCNPNETAGAITWVGVEWAGAAAPTQTTTSGSCDVWSLFVTSGTSTTAYKVFGSQSANFQ